METIWNNPTVQENTIFEGFSNSMKNFTNEYKTELTNFENANSLMCFSDYSGEEKEANYYVYSFIIFRTDNLISWNEKRIELRNKLLPDNRRISYKNYRDKVGRKYIEEFLKLANELSGYVVTFAFDKKLKSIFQDSSPIDFEIPEFKKYQTWTKDTIEKTFRITNLISFFVSGLSKRNQHLLWITDEDKIAPNKERVIQLTELFSHVLALYLNHNLGHVRVGTTMTDDGSRLIEDLCSIPDLVAGSYSDQLKTIKKEFGEELKGIFWIYSPMYKKKTSNLTWWINSADKNLCRLCFKVEKNGNSMETSFYHFFNRE